MRALQTRAPPRGVAVGLSRQWRLPQKWLYGHKLELKHSYAPGGRERGGREDEEKTTRKREEMEKNLKCVV